MIPNALRRTDREKAPTEESVALRAAVAVTVIVSIVAVMAQDIISTAVAITVLILTPFGFLISWWQRESKQVVLKIVLAAGLLAAFANFLRAVSGATSIDDTRGPLGEIFLWVQTLHSFDQPRRKDLSFGMAASVALIALGGSVALDASYLLFFIPWAVSAATVLVLTHHSEAREAASSATSSVVSIDERRARTLPGWKPVTLALLVTIVAGSGVFLFAPRGRGLQFQSLPFRLPSFVPVPQGSGIVNRGLPSSSSPGDSPAQPADDTYFGFANFVDLRVRGELSDALVMRVRAPQPAFWRGAIFDTYASSAWTYSEKPTETLGEPPIDIGPESGLVYHRTTEMTQTFYVERGQSNVIFAAYHPRELWFPGGSVEITRERSMRAGFILDEGLVYSVISDVPSPSRADLEIETGRIPPALVEHFTRLPQDLPARVRQLAHQIAGNETTILGKVEAIEQWLSTNTEYKLDIPPQPRGSDAVDYFLFEDRRGFCEHIASAMAIMLRELGVPARFVTGYDAGDRDIFSGYFEVRARDAHSWVEVFFPSVGWVPFDPTHNVPLAEPGAEQSVPGLKLLKNAFGAIGRALPDGIAGNLLQTLRSALAAVAASGPRVALSLLALALSVAGGSFGWRRLKRARKRRRIRAASSSLSGSGAFAILEEAAAEAGLSRPPSTTASEYAHTLTSLVPSASRSDINAVIAALERSVYGGVLIGADENRVAEEAARRVGEAMTSANGQLSRVR